MFVLVLIGLSMPSMQHDVIVELFLNRPSLAAELLGETFDVKIPRYTEARIVSAELTQIQPAEYRADAVAILVEREATVRVNIVEVQLSVDPDKRFSWPVYLTTTREQYRCAVDLLVVAPDMAVADWCAKPIEIGPPGFVLTPMVLRQKLIPVVTDEADAARRPELAILSAMAHGQTDAAPLIVKALVPVLEELATINNDRSTMYLDLVYNSVNEAARRILEKKMLKDYVFTSPFGIAYSQAKKEARDARNEGLNEGRNEAKREALLAVLSARGLDVSEALRQLIMGQKESAVLDRWLIRAANATSLDDVFKETN